MSESPSPELPDDSKQRLRQARIDFPGYYGAATPAEVEVMDQLVLAHAAYVATVRFNRSCMPEEMRPRIERMAFTVEQAFTTFREAVRSGPTFARCPEQAAVRRLLFVE